MPHQVAPRGRKLPVNMTRLWFFVVQLSLLTSLSIVVFNLFENRVWFGLDKQLDRVVAEKDIPGISIAVATSDGRIWKRAAGLADIKTGRAMTTNTQFPLGSIAHTVTAAGLMKTLEKHHQSLATSMAQWITDWPLHWQALTAATLARDSHVFTGNRLPEHPPHSDIDEESVLALLDELSPSPYQTELNRHQLSLTAQPATATGAARHAGRLDFNWWLLGLLIESIDGKRSFEQIIFDEVLQPLRLQKMTFIDRAAPDAALPAIYRWQPGQQRLEAIDSAAQPPRQLVATPTALVRFAMAHLDNHFLSLQLRQEMFQADNQRDAGGTGKGVGWYVGYQKMLEVRSQASPQLKRLILRHSPAVMRESHRWGSSLLLLCHEHHHAVAVATNVTAPSSTDLLMLALSSLELAH